MVSVAPSILVFVRACFVHIYLGSSPFSILCLLVTYSFSSLRNGIYKFGQTDAKSVLLWKTQITGLSKAVAVSVFKKVCNTIKYKNKGFSEIVWIYGVSFTQIDLHNVQ